MIIKHDASTVEQLETKVQRRILAHDGSLMAVEFSFKKGGVGYVHSHPHEQVGYIVQGRFEVEIGGEKETLSAGDTYYTGPNVPHGVVALEDGIIFDAFTPQRQDFLVD